MRRPFFIALEETSEDFVPEVPAEPVNEVEAEANTEEIVQDQVEIDETAGDVEEAIEEAEALQEQVEVNEAKLEAAPEEDAAASGVEGAVVEEGPVEGVTNAITEEDVIVSEESLRYTMAIFRDSVGLEKNVKLSIENRQYMTRKQRLKVSTEEIKDYIKRLYAAIKNMIKKLIEKIKAIGAKIVRGLTASKNFIVEKVNSLRGKKIEKGEYEDIKEKLIGIGMAEANYAVINSSVDFLAIDPAYWGKTLFMDGGNPCVRLKPEDPKAYAVVAQENLSTFTGKIGGILEGKSKFKKVAVEFDNEALKGANTDYVKLQNSLISVEKGILKLIDSSKSFYAKVDAFGAACGKWCDESEKKGKHSAEEIKAVKGCAVDAPAFVISKYQNTVKAYTRILNVFTSGLTLEKKEESK